MDTHVTEGIVELFDDLFVLADDNVRHVRVVCHIRFSFLFLLDQFVIKPLGKVVSEDILIVEVVKVG